MRKHAVRLSEFKCNLESSSCDVIHFCHYFGEALLRKIISAQHDSPAMQQCECVSIVRWSNRFHLGSRVHSTYIRLGALKRKWSHAKHKRVIRNMIERNGREELIVKNIPSALRQRTNSLITHEEAMFSENIFRTTEKQSTPSPSISHTNGISIRSSSAINKLINLRQKSK